MWTKYRVFLALFDAKSRRISRCSKEECDNFATLAENLQSNASRKGK